jgi:peptidoglycan/LPS O-acetylase OafA/YrhL
MNKKAEYTAREEGTALLVFRTEAGPLFAVRRKPYIPILRFFGEISYGLYLIHWLFFAGYDTIVSKLWPSTRLL